MINAALRSAPFCVRKGKDVAPNERPLHLVLYFI
jgi:hypothetical protein